MKERSEKDGDKRTLRNDEDELGGGGVVENENPNGRGNKVLSLLLHQSISLFHTGETPNLVQLLTHAEETHWTEVLDQVKAKTHQTC